MTHDEIHTELTKAVAELRHAYKNANNLTIRDQRSYARGLLAPQIVRIERVLTSLTTPAAGMRDDLIARLDGMVKWWREHLNTCGATGVAFEDMLGALEEFTADALSARVVPARKLPTRQSEPFYAEADAAPVPAAEPEVVVDSRPPARGLRELYENPEFRARYDAELEKAHRELAVSADTAASPLPSGEALEKSAETLLATVKALLARSEQDRRFGPAMCRTACLDAIIIIALRRAVSEGGRWPGAVCKVCGYPLDRCGHAAASPLPLGEAALEQLVQVIETEQRMGFSLPLGSVSGPVRYVAVLRAEPILTALRRAVSEGNLRPLGRIDIGNERADVWVAATDYDRIERAYRELSRLPTDDEGKP